MASRDIDYHGVPKHAKNIGTGKNEQEEKDILSMGLEKTGSSQDTRANKTKIEKRLPRWVMLIMI